MKVCRIANLGKVGETSSKYGYPGGGEQFEADMKAHEERYNYLWSEFVRFMKEHDATPDEFRGMFMRYYEEYVGGVSDGGKCVQ